MSTVTEFKAAFTRLGQAEAWELKSWIDAQMESAWDRQMFADAEQGRLDAAWQRAVTEVETGRTRPLDDLINDR